MSRFILTSILLTWACCSPSANIFRCVSDAGEVTYTDRGCPHLTIAQSAPLHASSAHSDRATPAPVINRADALSAADSARAQALSERLARQTAASDTRRAHLAVQQRQHRDTKATRCQQATAALRELRQLRRKGYSLKDHKLLAQQESKHKATKRLDC